MGEGERSIREVKVAGRREEGRKEVKSRHRRRKGDDREGIVKWEVKRKKGKYRQWRRRSKCRVM